MKIEVFSEIDIEKDLDLERVYSQIAHEAESLLSLKDSKDLEVNVTVTGREEIRIINSETRGIDSPTDVLSFPMLIFEKEGVLPKLEEVETILGDIIICYDIAKEQALSYGHGLKRELCFLFTHGLLHILGFDHVTDDMRLRMEDMQNNILNNLDIRR